MTPEGEARLRAHAAAVLAAGHPPPGVAPGLAEEMVAHLVEAVGARLASGLDEDAAIDAAILAFGGRSTVGAELARTYHTGLWAATVGVLLAPRDDDRAQPGPIGALRLLVAIGFVATLLASLASAVALTPVPAILATVVAVPALIGLAVLFQGLGLGRRWALLVGVGYAGLTVYGGVRQVVDAPIGTTTIPVLALYAVVCLLWLAGSAVRVSAFVAGSRPIGRALGAAIAIVVLGPGPLAAVQPIFADPTQAAAADVSMTIGMTCGIGSGQVMGVPVVEDQPTATLTAEMTWSRTDLLPEGLRGLFGRDGGDTAGFRVLQPEPLAIEGGGALPRWLAELRAPGVDTVSGEEIGWFGSTSPSVERIPDTLGSFTVGIDDDRIRSGHPIRIAWTLTPSFDGPQTWPRVEVAYAHLDRFVLIGTVRCGETARATANGTPEPGQGAHFLP